MLAGTLVGPLGLARVLPLVKIVGKGNYMERQGIARDRQELVRTTK